MKRLAHAHHHHVTKPPALLPQKPLGEQNLVEHFIRGEVANKAHRAGGAKLTVGGASDLRGDAEAGAPACDPQNDRFNAMAIFGFKNQLGCAVGLRVVPLNDV